MLLKWTVKKRSAGMDQIEVAQDREQWEPVLTTVINLRVL
jgi:hypothetical protein